MIVVFSTPNADKAKLIALLEADPYGKPSFSRNGYKVKDGVSVGLDREKTYLYIKCTDEFAVAAKEKLVGFAVPATPEETAAVTKKVDEDENNAEVGFGAIFG